MEANVFGVTPSAGADPGDDQTPPVPVSDNLDKEHEQEAAAAPEAPAPAPEPEPEPAKEPDEKEDDEEAELLSPDPNQGFKIGNKVYRDIESADRAFRQFAGRASAEARRRKDLESELQRTHALLETLRTERAQQPQTQETGTQAEPPPAPTPKRLTDLVSDDEFDQLVAEHGPAKAFRRLAELTEDRLKEALEESQRDIRPIVRQTQAVEATAKTFDNAAAMKDEAGNPVYPELIDPHSAEGQAVFKVWQKNFSDPALAPLAFTPHGVRIAVMEYRAANGQPASSRPKTAAGAAVSARKTADKSLQSMGTGGAASRPAGPVGQSDDEERIQELVRASRHDVFGVTMHR